MPPWALLACLVLLETGAARAELSGGVRLSVNAGVDTNARRDFAQVDGGTAPDMVTSVIGSATGRYQGERTQVSASYDVGVRKFMLLPLEDVLIQAATVQGSVALGRMWAAGVEGRAKDRRGGQRDYTDLVGHAFVEFVPDARLALRLEGGGHRFLFPPDFQFSFKATEFDFSGRYRFDKRHSLIAFGAMAFRTYHFLARGDAAERSAEPLRRQDSLLTGGVGYSYRGPFAFSFTYSYTEQASNSVGSSAMRHRLLATAGVRLPWEMTLLAQGTLLFANFPIDYPAGELLLLDDDEQHNSISVKLVRPLSDHVDVELRYALYHNRLPNEGLSYLRQMAWVGLGWRL